MHGVTMKFEEVRLFGYLLAVLLHVATDATNDYISADTCGARGGAVG